MRLGLMTAALPMLTLDQLAPWAAESGYQMLEIACWPAEKATRRYGGVSHIDCETIDKANARDIRAAIANEGLDISSLGYYPNPLDPDPAVSAASFTHLKRVIDAAVLLEVEIVGTFIGADPKLSNEQNLETFAKVWPPVIAYAAERGINIAIENCPMLWPDTWPGGTNLATTPAIWKRMFEIIPGDNFGLNYDPSHLVWQFIDYIRPIHEFREKLFHVHAKDMRVDRDFLYQDGALGCGFRWAIPKLPGLGDVNWNAFASALYEVGYDFVISVEHEDRSFEGTEEAIKRGFYLTHDVLKPLIH
jgi:sugar phosphate isomerase/epimerase